MAAAEVIPIEGVFRESPGASAPNWETRELPSSSYDQVMEQVTQLHDLRVEPAHITYKGRGLPSDGDFGDDVLDLSTLVFAGTGDVWAPGFDRARLAVEAKKSIRQITGLDSDKFFQYLPVAEIQRIWETYFEHLPQHVTNQRRVIARRPLPDEDIGGCDCLIRGFVSNRYVDIPDVLVLEKLREVIGPALDNEFVIDARFHNAYTTFTILNRESVDMLGDNPGDVAMCGMKVWLSDVGASSVKGMAHILRRVCSNGMTTSERGDFLFRQDHKAFVLEDFVEKLRNGWRGIPEQVELYKLRVKQLSEISFTKEEAEVRVREMVRGLLSQRRVEIVVEAFKQEPINNAYGVLQAITRAAQAVGSRIDHQREFEKAADTFTQRNAPHLKVIK